MNRKITAGIALASAALLVLPPGIHAQNTVTTTSDSPQIKTVMEILKKVPLIDGHNDLPWQYRELSNDFNAIDLRADTSKLKTPLVTDIHRLRAGGVGGQFWSVYVPVELRGADAVQAVIEQIDIVHQMVDRYPEAFELALTADDVERIHRHGKIASLVGMEGGHSINNSLAVLRMTYALGARYMTLTHVKNTDWADAAGIPPEHHGLTPFGEQVVHEMNRLGMLVDISHVSDETMRAALKVTKAPVIFSHSSARALCNSPRDVPDDVLDLTAQNGGVVMVCFYSGYTTEKARISGNASDAERARLRKLWPDNPENVKAGMAAWRQAHPSPHEATLNDVADHIDYIRKRIGIDFVGIGSDFEGFHGAIDGLEDVSKYPALLAELMRRGYTKDDIAKVAGLNLLRVFRRVERVAAELQRRQKGS